MVHFMEKWYNSSRSNPRFVPRDLTKHSLSSKEFYYFHFLHNLQRHQIFSFCFKGNLCFPFVFVIFSFSLALCIGLLSYFVCPSNRFKQPSKEAGKTWIQKKTYLFKIEKYFLVKFQYVILVK